MTAVFLLHVDDEMLAPVGNLVRDVLGPVMPPTTTVALQTTLRPTRSASLGAALAEIGGDVFRRGPLAHDMNRDAVTATIHDEIDRSTSSNRDIVGEQQVRGGGVRVLRLWLAEVDDRVRGELLNA